VTTEELIRLLDDAGAAYELLGHAHTESALAEAQALDVPAAEVAKTLVVKTADGYLRAVLPASERIDLHRLREVHPGSPRKVHLATEDDLARDYPDFELGAVPPIGGSRHDPVVVDSCLAQRDSIVVEAGSHEQSLRIPVADLLRITQAEVGRICTG
jgi:Ala-tRNA(Pro) deacylase